MLIDPSLFIILLGLLYAEIGAAVQEVFIPHLAIGLITWTLINGFMVGPATLFQRNRPQILQGAMNYLLHHRDDHARFGAAARLRYESTFNGKAMGEAYARFFRAAVPQ
ncbi:hypothetical protein OE810_02230 [Rhodobacteraceae bacterium XHP0102]|nr:hypothetical protein [Rhodobacteraceae bacterium XHP0102]